LLPDLRDSKGNKIPVVVLSNQGANLVCDAQVQSALTKAYTSMDRLVAIVRDRLASSAPRDQGERMSAIRVLHVDNEPDIREIVDVSLSLDPELEVRACAAGVDAIMMAAEWSPSLILLDVVMPSMDGPTTLANLRKNPRTAQIPVLFMTARTCIGDVEHFKSLGAQGVLSKPFDPMALAALVRSYLAVGDTTRGAGNCNYKPGNRGDSTLLSCLYCPLARCESWPAL
jgi:CheY-like chemotaxis protein